MCGNDSLIIQLRVNSVEQIRSDLDVGSGSDGNSLLLDGDRIVFRYAVSWCWVLSWFAYIRVCFVSCILGFGRRRLLQASFALAVIAVIVSFGFPPPQQWKAIANAMWLELNRLTFCRADGV